MLAFHERNEAKNCFFNIQKHRHQAKLQIHTDLCEVLISAYILPNKVRNKQFSSFVENIQTETFQQILYYDRAV